jgi:hypothetical protein
VICFRVQHKIVWGTHMARKRKQGRRINGRLSQAAADVTQRKATEARETIMQIQGDNLRARCRAMGIGNPTEQQLIAARSPMTACNAGRWLANHPDKDTLWSSVQHIRRTYTAWARVSGLPSRHAKCLSILVPPDPMETTADAPAMDLRTDVEKAQAARRAWNAVEGWLRALPLRTMQEVKAVILDDYEVRDAPGLETALRIVAEGMAGRRALTQALV